MWRYPKLEVRDWPDPRPGPKDVVLAVQACGVCGSDMHFYETDEEDYILYPGLKVPHDFGARVFGFERAGGFRPGHYVSVFGAGPIGLAATGLARAAGAGTIVTFEVSAPRRELAKKVGADYVYDPRGSAPTKC